MIRIGQHLQQIGCAIFLLFMLQLLHAQSPELLSPEQAFQFQLQQQDAAKAALSWKIAPEHYLYRAQIRVVDQNEKPLALDLPAGKIEHDAYFGRSEVYYDQLTLTANLAADQRYQVFYQGCAKDRICYPIQRIEIETDQWGQVRPIRANKILFPTQAPSTGSAAILSANEGLASDQVITAASDLSAQSSDTAQTLDDPLTHRALSEPTALSESTAATTWLNDQHWMDQLEQHGLFWRFIIFLGLGLLLAFTPCNLPMIPILSSVIARGLNKTKAAMMGLIFIISMASVYALMGWAAASLGLNLQRVLQHPASLMVMSVLFVVFALNLFGVFEFRLPQRWLNALDRLQGQHGQGLLGAGIMGAVSALLIGPCMTAPLAAVLLFIAQSQAPMQGVLLLFSLGLGMGLPLLAVILFGRGLLPKTGQWMYQIKALLAWMMLAAALYMLRPLLNTQVLLLSLVVFCLAWLSYLLWQIRHAYQLKVFKALWFYGCLAIVSVLVMTRLITPLWQQTQQATQTLLSWQQITEPAQWQAVYTRAQQQQRIMVVDVYADWCVACQPIEHRVLPDPEIQAAFAGHLLVRIDLTEYDAAQQAWLKDLDILGPPTFLFFDAQGKEIRHLRLTGATSKTQLLTVLKQLKPSSK